MTVLVSGRILPDIELLLPSRDLFDAIVAESGAVVQMANGASPTVLACAPDAALVAEFDRRNVAYRRGLCMVDVDAAAAPDVLTSKPEQVWGAWVDGCMKGCACAAITLAPSWDMERSNDRYQVCARSAATHREKPGAPGKGRTASSC